MIIRRFLPALAFSGPLAVQTFIQMSDPQFWMNTKNEGFAHETVNSITALVANEDKGYVEALHQPLRVRRPELPAGAEHSAR